MDVQLETGMSAEEKAKTKKVLDIGCGSNKAKGAVGLDVVELPGVDVVHDLNKFPYPFNDSTFDEIICNDVLEHVDDLLKVMAELHRLGKKGCMLRIKVPYALSTHAMSDPTHKHFFTANSFDYFTTGREFSHFNFYSKARFKVVSIEKIYASKGLARFLPASIRNKLSNAIFNICWSIKAVLEVEK